MNLQDSAGKCDELCAVECIMPCDRRQVKVVAGLPSNMNLQLSLTNPNNLPDTIAPYFQLLALHNLFDL